jgi:hypothetical protein
VSDLWVFPVFLGISSPHLVIASASKHEDSPAVVLPLLLVVVVVALFPRAPAHLPRRRLRLRPPRLPIRIRIRLGLTLMKETSAVTRAPALVETAVLTTTTTTPTVKGEMSTSRWHLWLGRKWREKQDRGSKRCVDLFLVNSIFVCVPSSYSPFSDHTFIHGKVGESKQTPLSILCHGVWVFF